MENYCGRVPVDRLVLACHGIGQKLAVSNIAHDAACMRLLMRQLSQVALHSLGTGGLACVCVGPGGWRAGGGGVPAAEQDDVWVLDTILGRGGAVHHQETAWQVTPESSQLAVAEFNSCIKR